MNDEFLSIYFTVEDNTNISCKKCKGKFKFADGLDMLDQHLKEKHPEIF